MSNPESVLWFCRRCPDVLCMNREAPGSTGQTPTISDIDQTWHVYRTGTGDLAESQPCCRCYAPAVVFVKEEAFCSRCAVLSLPDQSDGEREGEVLPGV